MLRIKIVLGLFSLVFLLAYSNSAYSIDKLPKGTILYMTFDDSSIIRESGQTIVRDLSGNNHSGVLNGATGVKGKHGEALSFDGTDDRIDLPGVVDYSDKVTVSAWVQSKGSNAWDNIICGATGDLILTIENNKLNFAGQGGFPIQHETWSQTLLNDGKWHHVAATYDGSKVQLFIDGKLEATGTASGSLRPGWKAIGSNHTGNAEYFKVLLTI